MDTLFPMTLKFPPGFTYLPDFITEEEEHHLLEIIRGIALHRMKFQGFEANRLVASFGYDYHFDKRSLTKGQEIPVAFLPIVEQAAHQAGLLPADIAELLVTEYPPDAVINWHRDAPPFETIIGLSLLSDCTFRLRPQDKAKQNRSALLTFPVKRRSLYIMRGEAREEWQHSIAPVKQRRYSLTFRNLKSD
jgi:alkylated DNA repair dioxygenase AlkB